MVKAMGHAAASVGSTSRSVAASLRERVLGDKLVGEVRR